MKKIPTAREYFNEELSGEPLTQESVVEGLIEFAKLHVKAALEAAANKVDFDFEKNPSMDTNGVYIDEDSILNAYPEDLIR